MADLPADRTERPTALTLPHGEESIDLAAAAVHTVIAERRRLWRREYTILVVLAFLLTVAAFAVYGLDIDPNGLRRYGYLGVFLIPLIGSATFILPMPGLAVIAGGGAFLDPVFGLPPWIVVGLLAGLGESLGELTGYAAGYGGRAVLEQRTIVRRLEVWMRRQGSVVMFTVAVIPNPFFDVAGVLAGVVRMPLWKFFLAVLLGKIIKSWYVAGAGVLGVSFLERWIG
jgi:membrane protein YqaA with SNARE-associated domain